MGSRRTGSEAEILPKLVNHQSLIGMSMGGTWCAEVTNRSGQKISAIFVNDPNRITARLDNKQYLCRNFDWVFFNDDPTAKDM